MELETKKDSQTEKNRFFPCLGVGCVVQAVGS